MAKEIKVVQCPKCGSTQKDEIKPDYFKCRNCNTEYFLDNDDITINHNINYGQSKPAGSTASPKSVLITIGAVIAFFITMGILLPRIFSSSPKRSSNAIVDKEDTFRWSDKDVLAFENGAGTLIIAIMGHREYDNDDKEKNTGNYIVFYDALSGKELSKQRLSQLPQKDLDNVQFEIFENGDIYAIANKSVLFKIDRVNTRLVNVPADFFSHHEDLAEGIAQVEFIGQEWGDGLKLMTNDGKSRTFFPIADKVYTDKTRFEAEKALAVKDGTAKTKTYFLFSERSDDFPDEKIKLMMYTQKDNEGGPNTRPFFQKKDYSFFYNKKVISDMRQGSEYVISYKDLTPGRLYFSPEILYSDKQYVLIKFKANAAQNANVNIQCIAVPDGRIVFTLPFDKEKYVENEAFRYKGGFVLKTYESMYIVGMNGKLIKEFKMIQ